MNIIFQIDGGIGKSIAATASAGNYSGILGGYNNLANGSYSTISGGSGNIINGASYASISGGISNNVSGNYSAILGGVNNSITGDYSAILGGSNNSDNGLTYVAVFGNGIIAQAADTFHVSCLNACNTPMLTGGLVTGTLAFVNATAGMVAVGFPLGSKIAMIV